MLRSWRKTDFCPDFCGMKLPERTLGEFHARPCGRARARHKIWLRQFCAEASFIKRTDVVHFVMMNVGRNHAHFHYWQKIPAVATILFLLGLAGGIAFRLTPFLRPLDPRIGNAIWYAGSVAYSIFYLVRISIVNHRREICRTDMLERLKKNVLSPHDIEELHEMVASYCRSKVKYNYIVWFAISVISLIGAVLFT